MSAYPTIQTGPEIDVKRAVQLARQYFKELYQDEQLPGVLLEEVELSSDEKVWSITFGYDTTRPVDAPDDISLSVGSFRKGWPKYVRDYKTIRLRADTGALIDLKIRSV